MKIIFCNVAWMEHYQGERIENSKSGGDNPDKWEKWNFKNIDGKYYGFVEPMHSDGWRNNINISKIALDEKVTNKDFIDNVLVIWVSTNGRNNKRIVGWYKNAQVYRCTRPRDKQLKIVLDEKYAKGSKLSEEYNCMKDLRTDYRKHGNGVNIVADVLNGCLLSVEERKNDKWKYSRYFGRQYGHTLWYAKNNEEYLKYLKRLIKEIDNYLYSSNRKNT